jgi:DNA helicase II / ATP-dependent DNA helicase PcrA
MPNIEEVLRQTLTDLQYATAIDRGKEILCLACAGSGKSTTLAYRIAKLIADGENPTSIVAFTFTIKSLSLN